MGTLGLRALGVNLTLDATKEQLVPDSTFVPDFSEWDNLSPDDARSKNQSTRRPLRNGNQSPGCQTYLERTRELSHTNHDSFRTVRRIPPPRGKQQARLGNAYEFFRCLETLTAFWDDPTQPPELPPSPEAEPSSSEANDKTAAADQPADQPAANDAKDDAKDQDKEAEEGGRAIRSAAGSSMPADFRNSLITAFVKLLAYDFGCNVSMARTEPRLQLSTPNGSRHPRKSYIPSQCGFVFQSPKTREEARAGTVYGPVGAVSARATTDMTTPDVEMAQSLDLAREIVAALITAQHRAREGKQEVRFGEGQWWTQEKRWGGGPGGPIGREIDRDAVQGDKDAPPGAPTGVPQSAPSSGPPSAKRPRRNLSIYDSYRMVRPPSATWDKKARYEAIGRARGTPYDDIFVVSSLFHHVSVMRVRVPTRLLEVLDGSPEPGAANPTAAWGGVQAVRSPWFDLYDVEQRLEAMRYLWGVMAYQMRKDETPETSDVAMADA